MSAEPSTQSTPGVPPARNPFDEHTAEELLRFLNSLGIELRSANGKLQLTAPAGAMTPELQEAVRRRKAELLAYTSSHEARKERVAALSFAQQRLWLLDRFSPHTAVYNIPQHWQIRGAVDRGVLQEAIAGLCQRHSSLRTRIEMRGRDPKQIIMPSVDCPIGFTDLAVTKNDNGALDSVYALLVEDGRRPFDLAAEPLIRFHLYRLAHEHYVVSYVAHHILADQSSLYLLQRDLGELYQAGLERRPAALPLLSTDYAAIAEQERSQAGGPAQQRDMDYWRERLRDMPTTFTLPFAAEHPLEATQQGARISRRFDEQLTASLRRISNEANTSAYFVMLTVFAALLSRYTGLEDICIGTPLSTRTKREHEDLVGLFINMLPLRCKVSPSASMRGLLDQMRNAVLSDFEHGGVPFQKLVAELHPDRTATSPFFQILFAFNPGSTAAGEETQEVDLLISKYDLTFQISEQRDTYTAHFEYRTDLFTQEDIEAFSRTLFMLMKSMTDAPDKAIGLLQVLSPQDAEKLGSWNETALAYDRQETLVSLFSRQAVLHPQEPAILSASGELTYAGLAEEVARIAALLQDAGAKKGEFIAVCLDRTPRLIASVLAVLSVGAAYLPLDPRYPEGRLLYMLRDSGARILLATPDDLSDQLLSEQPGLSRVDPESRRSQPETSFSTLLTSIVSQPEDAAYLIYTSGSTGTPKGTVVEHGNAVALLAWAQDYFEPESLQAILASTSICFDLSVFEIFLPLATGNAVVLVKDVLELRSTEYADQVTMINTVPSAMSSLLHGGIPVGVRAVCMAGEFLPAELVDRVYEAGVAKVFDLYGPTETTVYSTAALRAHGAPPTIGKPIANSRTYVLDERGKPLPPGAIGELFIGGSGVSRGYLNRPEITAERFVQLPEIDGGERLYRTGDLVRYTNSGSLIYHGRRDQQIKLRGHRIELGEIENALRDVVGASQVAVVVQTRSAGEMLMGFVNLTGAAADEEQRWHEGLRRRLPAYMLPARVQCLPSFPLTPNGKIDRAALRFIEVDDQAEGMRYPQTLLEQWLANIFAAHLGIPTISREAHFFDDLGGNSLMAFQIFVEIERRTGIVLMLAVLFEAPTVEQLAAVVRRQQPRKMKHLRLSSAGSNERVTYVVGDTFAVIAEQPDSNDGRIMSVAMVDASHLPALLEEVILVEAARPPITLVSRRAHSSVTETVALELRRADFKDISTRLID